MATQIKIKNFPTGYQSIITNGRHSIVGDEPVHSKGTDLGLSPTELVLSGIAMCKVATVRVVARRRGWEIRDVYAELEQEVKRGEGRSLATRVKVAIHIEGDITDEQRTKLMKEADRCYVHRMLDGSWDIESSSVLEEAGN